VLAEKLRPRNIVVEEISIINFQFSSAFTTAIENKVTAEQNALAAKNKLQQIIFEAQQKIEAAKGDATKIQLIEGQLKQSPSYIEWLKVDKWDGRLPAVTSGVPFINVASYTGESNVQTAESTGYVR
jgi:regulator of protease activity HflC (stomatin/prohibitin superfamily)